MSVMNSCGGSRAWVRQFRLELAGDELAAQQLADGRFRDGFHERVAAWKLEACKSRVAAERVKSLRVDSGPAFDKGDDDLAPPLVGQANDRNFRYGRMKGEAAFDIHGR